HHAVIGDWTIVKLKNATRIIVRMQADYPLAASLPLHGERQLAAVSPFALAAFDARKLDGALSDADARVSHQAFLCPQLRSVREMLHLTSTASIDAIVRARWLDSLRRRLDQLENLAARKSLSCIERDAHAIARRGARHEDDNAFCARNTVTTGRDAVD